jgi:hypothetical protein
MLSETLRSRWFSGCVHAALWVLLALIITGVGGKRPPYQAARPDPDAVIAPVPVAKLEGVFPSGIRTNWPTDAASLNPFFTAYFIPKTPPPPPPPTTRKIELTYRGFYQTADSPKHALILFDGALVGIPVGSRVATNLFVANVTMTTLTLTNLVPQTNVLELNTKKQLEIPIR